MISKLKLDDVIDAQIYLLISLSKKMVNYNKVTIKLYIKDIFDMIEGLGLNGSSYEDVKEKFLYSYNEIYNQFIEDKEYVYENFIVNHMFNECFPYNKDGDIVRVYNELVSKFVVIKLNTIICISWSVLVYNTYKNAPFFYYELLRINKVRK